jgi:alpha-ribazole phosphatase
MSVWLVRHTRVNVAAGRCYGRADVPLAATYEVEAAQVREQLGFVPEEVWSSPAGRCRRLAESWRLDVRCDERLQELNFGDWEGRNWESFWTAESEAWALDPWTKRPPGGESGEQLEARVAAVREAVKAEGWKRRVVVVTHAGVIRVWRRMEEGLSRSESLGLVVPFGSCWNVG